MKHELVITSALGDGEEKEPQLKALTTTAQNFRIKKKNEGEPQVVRRSLTNNKNQPEEARKRSETADAFIVVVHAPKDEEKQGKNKGTNIIVNGLLCSKDSTAAASDRNSHQGAMNESKNMRKLGMETFNGKIPMKTTTEPNHEENEEPKNLKEKLRAKKALTASNTEKILPIDQAEFQMFEKFVTYSKKGIRRADLESYYIIGKTIGKGSYASVRLALSKETGQKVAIKTYEKGKLTDESRRKNVRRETEILDRANHPNIIRLQDFFHSETQV